MIRRLRPIPAALVAIIFLTGCAEDDGIACESFRFDSGAWRSRTATAVPREGELSQRQRLADGLIQCGTLDGESEAQVRRLLGPPDERVDELGEWTYYTGPERGSFSLDDETLNIKFARDRVAQVTRGGG